MMSVQDQINQAVAGIQALLLSGSCALSPAPKRVVSIYPGTSVSWDDCCNGQLSFQVNALTPIWQSAGRVSIKNPCTISWWEVQIDVKILRCAATVNSAGVPPSPAQISADGNQLLNDMQNILKALEGSPFSVYNLNPWVPSGPEGGCVGGSFTFMIRCDPDPCV